MNDVNTNEEPKNTNECLNHKKRIANTEVDNGHHHDEDELL